MNDGIYNDGIYNEQDEEIGELPWLIFTLNRNAYAVNIKYVSGIEQKPENITPLPKAPEIYCGLAEFWEEMYTIIDMRKAFHLPSIDEEVDVFRDVMEQRKQDHIKWVEVLEKCVETGEKFSLATDPHKCAFGRWYYDFVKHNHAAGFHIRRVEKPHTFLHETAPEVIGAIKKGDKETAVKLLQKARKEYVPKVLEVLDEAETAFRDTFRETVVIISDEEQRLGLLVDEVLLVDNIEPTNGSDASAGFSKSKFLESIAKNERVGNEIFVINEDELLKLSDVEKFRP